MENMAKEQTHTLVLVSTYITGAEEWLCPACGHRILKTRLPQEQVVVMVDGDEPNKHLPTGESPVSQTLFPLNVSRLAPWLDWINKVDFDELDEDNPE
jgi:DNA-directed RNA polymerase subunit RPC12/RpoP